MAILAAGVNGRYCFDFYLNAEGINFERAFLQSMREPVEELLD
ncbi:hypothetical protein J2753_001114 [Halolamina salifodinae]|uniref:Uncharacterized protein n=1 Tax=Halolamina salifodinae TaxID=1202767 RepID=A0A8T4GVY8_9EURY|nr:hypothetical protein [Halolamina salifodinae]